MSNAILLPPSSLESVVAPTQAIASDSSWLPSGEVPLEKYGTWAPNSSSSSSSVCVSVLFYARCTKSLGDGRPIFAITCTWPSPRARELDPAYIRGITWQDNTILILGGLKEDGALQLLKLRTMTGHNWGIDE